MRGDETRVREERRLWLERKKEKTPRPKFAETIAYRVMRKRQVNDQTKADFVPVLQPGDSLCAFRVLFTALSSGRHRETTINDKKGN